MTQQPGTMELPLLPNIPFLQPGPAALGATCVDYDGKPWGLVNAWREGGVVTLMTDDPAVLKAWAATLNAAADELTTRQGKLILPASGLLVPGR